MTEVEQLARLKKALGETTLKHVSTSLSDKAIFN